MSEKVDFRELFAQFMRARGRWRNSYPEELQGAWVTFVDDCISGYGEDMEDYFNSLGARSALAAAIEDPQLGQFSEMEDLRSAVADTDARFRELLMPDAFPNAPEGIWWDRGVVCSAGPKMVHGLRKGFGVEIDLHQAWKTGDLAPCVMVKRALYGFRGKAMTATADVLGDLLSGVFRWRENADKVPYLYMRSGRFAIRVMEQPNGDGSYIEPDFGEYGTLISVDGRGAEPPIGEIVVNGEAVELLRVEESPI
jgi:hypothetical protein